MATNSFVELNLPEARELADLTGIQYDLNSARDFATQLLNAYSNNNREPCDALTTAVLVRYARSFVTGVRERLRGDALATLSPEQLERHDYFCTLRDKYAAHSVNAFEESHPVARFWVEKVHQEGIEQISCQHIRVTGLSRNELNQLIELATTLLTFVAQRIEDEQAKVLAIVRALPIEVVLKGQNVPRAQAPRDPNRPRRPY